MQGFVWQRRWEMIPERKPHTRGNQLKGYGLVALAALLFGVNGTLSRFLLDEGISSVTLGEFRMVVGGFCLGGGLLLSRQRSRISTVSQGGWVIAYGLAWAMLTYGYLLAISRLPLAIALVISYTAAAWMTIGESVVRRSLPSLMVTLAVLLTFTGAFLVSEVWNSALNHVDASGLLYAYGALFAYIAYLLLGKRVGQQFSALSSLGWGSLVAGLCWLIVQPPWHIPATTWQTRPLLLLCSLGVIGMAVPFACIQYALRYLQASRVGIAGTLELVTTGVIAYFWLGQRLDEWQLAGCLLVLVGMIFLQYERTEP